MLPPAAYCEKCGDIFSPDSDNEPCPWCHTAKNVKNVPEEYLDKDLPFIIDNNFEEEFIEKFIKTSPIFDQTCWDKRKEWEVINARQMEMICSQINLSNNNSNKTNISEVTCAYCGSTNVNKIGAFSRAMSIGFFGLGSKKIGKQWHCNNCGSDF